VRGLDAYREAAGDDAIAQIRKLAKPLEGKTVVHVNSTKVGGGVAEILDRLVPLMNELGIRARWEVIQGDPDFYGVTKGFHNGLQGNSVSIRKARLDHYVDVNRTNAETLRPVLEGADFVFIHDPQPAPLVSFLPKRSGKWVWRCHIDVSRPHRPIWKFLRDFVQEYDASIFSLASFAQPLKHPQYLIPPSIDPLALKNKDLPTGQVADVAHSFHLDPNRPVLLQVSRFDRFKDPVGVIEAYRLLRSRLPVQLVLAGGTADDDPEGAAVLEEVTAAAEQDPDIHILLLPPNAHVEINALQRRADVVLQKSLREGFGLTVTEALWKRKPVIGGNTGGIRLQVVDGHTGWLVNTPEGAALRLGYLLNRPALCREMGEKARRFVQENFLLTRHLREYLSLMLGLGNGTHEGIEVR